MNTDTIQTTLIQANETAFHSPVWDTVFIMAILSAIALGILIVCEIAFCALLKKWVREAETDYSTTSMQRESLSINTDSS